MIIQGYAHPSYASAFGEFATPRELPGSGGWILERTIPGASERDATGAYPMFACRDWSQLGRDLRNLGDSLVSLTLVADPFGEYTPAELQRSFPDLARPFKPHFVVDLKQPPERFVSAHHRRYARKALARVTVEPCPQPARLLSEWEALYRVLIRRHAIRGLPAFSRQSFATQLQVPGLVVFRAVQEGETVGMILWYVMGEVGYYHLAAYNERGYQAWASFALFWRSLEHFAAAGLKWLNLGGGAGVDDAGSHGLTQFKHGWATGVRTAYLCGRIFDHQKYAELTRATGAAGNYFPLYRSGEFGRAGRA